ncbi:MAG: Ig-like domain-containing protein, partial [Melioribacteraceae bacterium]|nr:Ig-like domain-containing protein [Melioribacteraceae bacterium]
MKRIYFFINMLIILSSIVPFFAQSYSGGYGTPLEPYIISTALDLIYLSTHSGDWGKHFKQSASIIFDEDQTIVDWDGNGSADGNGTSGFIPIGNQTTPFTGSYNGDKHTISNIYINRNSNDYIGLFGYIYNASISNIGLADVYIYGINNVGGLVGKSLLSDVSNSFTTGSVTGSSNVGGLVGYNHNALVNYSFSTANVTGNLYIGGLVGYNYYLANISNSYFRGFVYGYHNYVGGLVGYTYHSTVSASYSSGIVDGSSNVDTNIGGLIGSIFSSTVSNSFWDIETSGQLSSFGGTGKTTLEMKNNLTFLNAGWSPTIWYMDDSYNDGYPYLAWENPSGTPLSSPPILTSLSPADNSIIALNLTELVLNFDKPVTSQTGKNITIYNESNSIVEQIDAASPKVNVSGNQVTITLDAPLSYGGYYVMIDAGAFSNTNNDAFEGILDNTTWNFTIKATDEVPGSALSFPGSGSNYVSVPYSALLNPSDNFTIEFWTRIEGNQNTFSCPLSSQTTIFDGETPISSNGYYFYVQDDNRWAAWLGRGTIGGTSTAGWEIISGPTVDLGKWYHLAMTFLSGTMKFFVNGELQGTANGIAYTPNSTASFNVGDLGEVQGTFPFNGKVDEIRFWNTARSQQQIQQNMHLTLPGNTENLVAYFQLNEGTGTTTNDIVGSFSGSFVGSPTWINSSIPVGSGMSESTPSFSSGSTTLSNVTLTTTDDFDNPVDLSISQINVTPNSLSGISGTSLSDRYWKINAFGSPGIFSVNLTFTVPSDFTNEGNASAGLYTLYHRLGNEDGSWNAVISGASGLTSTSITFDGITSFSQFAIGTTDPLPVELISFEGYNTEEGVVLNWQTATEVNNYGFEILRSAQNDSHSEEQSDEESWEKIGFVQGHGNS